jgi:hypothetical protein
MKTKIAKQLTTKDVEGRVAALKREIKRLIHLIGEGDDEIVGEAVYALHGLPGLVSGQLAAALSRPRSRVHRLKLIFLARVLGQKGSLDTQKALHRLTKLKEDDGVANAAADALGELLGDEMQALAEAGRRGPQAWSGSSTGNVMTIRQPHARQERSSWETSK